MPLFTHNYSSPPIKVILNIVGVIASLVHSYPRTVSWCSAHSVLSRAFVMVASARHCELLNQRCSSNAVNIPAVTFALPDKVSILGSPYYAKRCKSAKFDTRDIIGVRM